MAYPKAEIHLVRQLRKPASETAGLPLFELADPKVRDSVEAPRLSKQCMVILGRLSLGPATIPSW